MELLYRGRGKAVLVHGGATVFVLGLEGGFSDQSQVINSGSGSRTGKRGHELVVHKKTVILHSGVNGEYLAFASDIQRSLHWLVWS